MKKNKIILFMICINLFSLSGCWNYREMNETRLVTGLAIDYDEKKDEYITTIEIINLKEGKMKGELYESRGKLPFDGIRNVIMKTGRKLYFAHAKVIIISEEIAKRKIISVLDYIYRDAEFREDMGIVVSKEKTAREILEKYTAKDISPIIGYHLEDQIKSEKIVAKYHSAQIWKFIKDLYAEGVSPTLPAVKNISDQKKTYPVLEGLAVFKRDKLVGYISNMESQSFLWIIDHIQGGLIEVDAKISEKLTPITLEIIQSKTKIKPIDNENELMMKIDIETDVIIGNIGGTEDFIGKKGRAILKKDAEKQIKKQVEDTIKKVQKDYDSDIFKFSSSIKKEMPDLWKKIKPKWDDIFKSLKTEVNVVVNIRGSGLKSKPIKVGQ
ncbi:Ger(x)C family spore germination protein [Marinisporobacter balticus]|uniref:Spore germination protein KC n=1 Tax=Marinisporobacter balticus TaxID=2018667 RepID=A0A4R2KUY7_9FIRM|nr:Ger(x)C family spore germination protein [Marinisporobacter balticus]TCO74966.1 spore germination protein KC [Marinisporobacter balticus]